MTHHICKCLERKMAHLEQCSDSQLKMIEMLRNENREMKKVVEAAGKICCVKMGDSCPMQGFEELRLAFKELDQ